MKVTLLGDSIRQQYDNRVREILGEDFEVWSPKDNCRFVQFTLRGLFEWAESMSGSQIVHWNNGHWDVCRLFDDGTFSDEDDYIRNMLRVAEILQKRNCLVIFATTTPVRDINQYNRNEDIDRFNRRLVPLLRERKVIINDLNGLLRDDIEANICEDTIHLSGTGVSLCAEQVAKCIREAAEMLKYRTDCAETKNDRENTTEIGAPVLIE